MNSGVVGIGTDLLDSSRIEAALSEHGERFARRILCEQEWTIFSDHKRPGNYLAKAFAAKEALSKALGTGIGQGVSFQDFCILRSAEGRPEVSVNGVALQHMKRLGGRQFMLSLSDEGHLIQAFAVLSS